MRVLVVQYGGDYRKAIRNFATNIGETFYAQKYSVDAIAKFVGRVEEIATLCCISDEAYDEVMPNGVRAIGTGFSKYGKILLKRLMEIVIDFNPSHVILRTPILEILRWSIKNNVKLLPLFADSFKNKKLTDRIYHYQLARLLNNDKIHWVTNCNVPASLSLVDIGVKPDKIIPWEWPSVLKPESYSIKTLTKPGSEPFEIFYVGRVLVAKGLDDVLVAVKQLCDQKCPVLLTVAGGGELEYFRDRAVQLGIQDQVNFLGLVPNTRIIDLMRAAHCVVVPSRHEYPEGFPKAALEALCSRTPLVASDHPVFKGILVHEQSALIFSARNATAMAECFKRLMVDADLYYHLSVGSAEAWQKLQIPIKWADLIDHWLFTSPENESWFFQHRLSSGHYAIWNDRQSSAS